MTIRDLITNALIEADWIAIGEPLPTEQAVFLISKLNDMFDEWAALQRYAYNMGFSLFTLVPSLSPHTIGPSGATFTVTQRPVRIESAAIVLNTSNPSTDVPIAIRDDAWWAANRVKAQTSTIPTSLYYSPDWPNGSLYFWPIPKTAYQVRLELWVLLSQIATLDDVISLPPGYKKAITLSLAESLGGPRSADPTLQLAAQKARAALQSNNLGSPRMSTREFGGKKRGFNWQTGI